MIGLPRQKWMKSVFFFFLSSFFLSSFSFAADTDSFQEKLAGALFQKQWFFSMAISYLAGLLSSLTACVYPLIPITVSLFGAKEKGVRLHRSVGLAFVFVLGIAVMYTSLGIAMSLLGKQFGSFLSSTAVMIPVIIVFFLMAVSLFGAFSLRLPQPLHKALVQIGGKGFWGAFSMGLVCGVVAAPCTGPVLASLLAVVASQGSLWFGVSLLFSYAMGLGTLFFFVAVFTLSLPRSGPFMEKIKHVLAVCVIIVALYFIRNISQSVRDYGQPEILFLVFHGLLACVGIVLGAIHLPWSRNTMMFIRKVGGVLCLCLGGFGILSWILTPTPLAWYKDESVFVLAKEKKVPILIDFSARWCLPCVEMETKTFSDVRVKNQLSRFLLWKVDCSVQCKEPAQKYGIDTLPGVILIDSQGQVVYRIHRYISAEELLPILQSVK